MSTENLPFDLTAATGNDTAAGDAPTPEGEWELLIAFTLAKLDALEAIIAGADDETINALPGVEGANPLGVILRHVCGMMRHWSRTVILGIPEQRDREAEFEPGMSVAQLVQLTQETSERFEADMSTVDLGAAPVGRNDPGRPVRFWATTNRGILLHIFEEICQHLGHAEITRDLLAAQRG